MVVEKKFRETMGHFPTGVTVVTTRERDGDPAGLTVSAFTSVSLHPILVMVCIHQDASAHDLMVKGVSFAVNVLSSEQGELAKRFATGIPEERFQDLDVEDSPLGNPLFPDSLAWLDCRVTEVFPGGDHSLVLAEVVSCFAGDGDPLLFHRGALRSMGS